MWDKSDIYDMLTKFPEYAAIDNMHMNMLYGQNWDYVLYNEMANYSYNIKSNI